MTSLFNFEKGLEKYFSDHSITRSQLYFTAKKFFNNLQKFEANHLSQINNVIVGSNNRIRGNDNVLYGNSHKILGNNNYVAQQKYSQIGIKGDFILRVWAVDFDIRKV